MPNHPNRSKSIEASIRRMIERNQVGRVEIVTQDGKRFTATAYPVSHHPIIAKRRNEGFQKLADKLGRSLTIAEAQSVVDATIEEPLYRKIGAESIEAAVAGLAEALRLQEAQ